jgi:hypothetical protein
MHRLPVSVIESPKLKMALYFCAAADDAHSTSSSAADAAIWCRLITKVGRPARKESTVAEQSARVWSKVWLGGRLFIGSIIRWLHNPYKKAGRFSELWSTRPCDFGGAFVWGCVRCAPMQVQSGEATVSSATALLRTHGRAHWHPGVESCV